MAPSPHPAGPMKCKWIHVGTLAALSACATAPISFNSTTPDPGDATYACALRKVNELEYTVTNTSKDGRFITGIKQTSGLGTKLLTGRTYKDQLTVSVFDADSATRRIRVTAASVEERSNLFGTSTDGRAPTDAAKADASEVLRACGKGVISQEGKAFLADGT
jgi:hypothetical protein